MEDLEGSGAGAYRDVVKWGRGGSCGRGIGRERKRKMGGEGEGEGL